MKKKRIRFGILWVDGKFIELFSMRPHTDGWIMWTPGSVKHVTTIKEPDAISSHRTNQDTSKQTPLSRLFYEDVDFDEELAKLANLRKLEESKYDQILLYQNREFWDTLLTTEFELVTEDRKRDILRYIDLSNVFGDIVKKSGKVTSRRNHAVSDLQGQRSLGKKGYRGRDIYEGTCCVRV